MRSCWAIRAVQPALEPGQRRGPPSATAAAGVADEVSACEGYAEGCGCRAPQARGVKRSGWLEISSVSERSTDSRYSCTGAPAGHEIQTYFIAHQGT